MQEKWIHSINSNFDYCSIEYEDLSNFVNDHISKDILESDQDPKPSPSETYDFTLNESYSSKIDFFSFMSKEDSSLDEKNKKTMSILTQLQPKPHLPVER